LTLDLLRRRMRNERLIGASFSRPEDVVRWFGAVQSQEYADAKRGVGQRVRGCTDTDVEQALQEGRILRTHVMRPTWHFVTPADIRWMLELTAPRVKRVMGYYERRLELDDATFARSNAAIRKSLKGGKHLTRKELGTALSHAGIVASGQRLGHLVSRAELDAVVCSGARKGKQLTYALLDERVPAAKKLSREQALTELTTRYFRSHGPATPQDFAWWSGLTVGDAKEGIELAGAAEEEIDGKSYWAFPSKTTARVKEPLVHLLPPYDEYFIAYKDRSALSDPAVMKRRAKEGTLDRGVVFLNGKIVGGWRRTFEKDAVTLDMRLLRTLDRAQTKALHAEAERYARFLGVPLRSMIRL
jgi:hypothetical protein